jgi:hypothetical protein
MIEGIYRSAETGRSVEIKAATEQSATHPLSPVLGGEG